jgi:hypothetical protein
MNPPFLPAGFFFSGAIRGDSPARSYLSFLISSQFPVFSTLSHSFEQDTAQSRSDSLSRVSIFEWVKNRDYKKFIRRCF